MRIGMYNRWLHTLGGGEKHSLTIAEHLSKSHAVDVISHKQVSKESAEERLNLDLSRVEFITTPDCHPLEISPLTADYDFFINTSYLDFFPSLARINASLIFFPANVGRRITLLRRFKGVVREWFKIPSLMTGVHAFNVVDTSFRWSTDSLLNIHLPYNKSTYEMQFDLCAIDARVTGAELHLEDEIIDKIQFSERGSCDSFQIQINNNHKSSPTVLTIQAIGDIKSDGEPKMEIRDIRLSLPQHRMYHTLFERIYTNGGVRLQHYHLNSSILDYLDTYDKLWTISDYSQKWIKRYWHRESDVINPPVDVGELPVDKKHPQILNVGRFFAGSHNKKHLELVTAFKNMVDRGLSGWELHLVGGSTPGEEHQAYMDQVRNAVVGYPITIHLDAPFEELVYLYATSSIYWHATGYGEDEKKNPERFEHFGITTVEAMASGCVPIVIDKGGQPELVKHNINGYLWSTLAELQTFTLGLIDNDHLREKLAAQAVIDSTKYDKNHHNARLDELLTQLGVR